MLPDNACDRGVDGLLVGDVHLKDLQRVPFSLCRLDKLVANAAISSCDVAHGRDHRVTPPCELQGGKFPKTTPRTGHNNHFSVHLEGLFLRNPKG